MLVCKNSKKNSYYFIEILLYIQVDRVVIYPGFDKTLLIFIQMIGIYKKKKVFWVLIFYQEQTDFGN